MNDTEPAVLDDIDSLVQDQSDFSKVVEILLNDNYKRRKTILHTRQVSKITTIDVLSQIWDITFLKEWINNYSEWRTSGDGGRGRNDIVDISKFQYGHDLGGSGIDDDLLKRLRKK
jgi:hypothetical protein